MLKRVIPILQLKDEALVKTKAFKKPFYIGDPVNTVKIFNELEVDELAIVDIEASKKGSVPNFDVLRDIADECFMPLAYGGGVTTFEQAKEIFKMGYEKIIFNSLLYTNPQEVKKISDYFGAQSIVGAIDVKSNLFGKKSCYSISATKNEKMTIKDCVRLYEKMGVGEILLTSVDSEGSWSGLNDDLLSVIDGLTSLPVIINGGVGNSDHILQGLSKCEAVGTSSFLIFQGKGNGVLVNFPDRERINDYVLNEAKDSLYW